MLDYIESAQVDSQLNVMILNTIYINHSLILAYHLA